VALRLAVVYRDEDAGFGGRLYADLSAALGPESVSRDSREADVVVVVLGPEWADAADVTGRRRLEDPRDPVRTGVETARGDERRLIAAVVDGAEAPGAAVLPDGLDALVEAPMIRLTDEYWDAAVERLRVLVPPSWRPQRRLLRLLRRRWKASIVSIVSVVGSIVGILATLGVLTKTPPEAGSIAVREPPRLAMLGPYLASAGECGDLARYPASAAPEGRLYDVDVQLRDPSGGRYSLRVTLQDEATRAYIQPFVDMAATCFAASDAVGTHQVWIPCPPDEWSAEPYVGRVSLTNDGEAERPLAVAETKPQVCVA
jgi:hypothetical protein